MTDASRKTIDAALAAFERMTTDEREVFEYVIKMRNPEPAPKRGRPRKSTDEWIDNASKAARPVD